MSENDFFYVDAEIFTNPIHRKKMGQAVWLYLWIIDKADPETGLVPNYSDEMAAKAMGCPLSTARKYRAMLEKHEYIRSPFKRDGLVYIIEAANGLFKIGITVGTIEHRLQGLQSQSPIDLSLVMTIETNNALRLEQALHQRFQEKRHHGEWFSLDKNDVEAIYKQYGGDS